MRRILLISLSVITLLSVSCGVTTIPVIGNGAGSPRECVDMLVRAVNGRDTSAYSALLAPDFTFYFNEDDVGREVNGYTIPETWDFDEEIAFLGEMFDNC
ncbi:MAG: hypothetical protein GY771_15215 [bacterium]|nr:hypothetical protein [bacterium]